MSTPSRLEGSYYVTEGFSCATFDCPAGSLSNDDWAAGTGNALASDKQIHRYRWCFSEKSSVTAAALTTLLGICRGATGSIRSVKFGVFTLMSAGGGDDRTVVFDLKNQAGTSVLTGTVTVDKTKAAKTGYDGTINTAALAVGNALYLDVTVGGSTGTQALGIFVQVDVDEDPS